MPITPEIEVQIAARKEIEDFISTPPSWLLRSGITTISVIVVTLISISGFIRYPDKVTGQGILTSENPPIKIISIEKGVISKVYKRTNQHINHGDTILYIENQSKVQDIKTLKTLIVKIANLENPIDLVQVKFVNDLQVGELQSQYGRLQLAYAELISSIDQRSPELQIQTINNQLLNLKKLSKNLIQEQQLLHEEFSFVKKDYSRNKHLHENLVISDQEFEKLTLEFIRSRRQIEISGNAIIQNSIQQNDLLHQMNKINEDRVILLNTLLGRLKEIASLLSEGINAWNLKYFIRAEGAGILILNSDISENVYINNNQTVANIVPVEGNGQKFVRMYIAGQGIGKINKGQKVIVRVEGFPYKEFGTIQSSVSSISIIPDLDKEGNLIYEIKVSLKDTLLTNYGYHIPYQPSTGVIGDIITKDQSVLRRIFNEFLNLIKNNLE